MALNCVTSHIRNNGGGGGGGAGLKFELNFVYSSLISLRVLVYKEIQNRDRESD
jgi:hypothetical protein